MDIYSETVFARRDKDPQYRNCAHHAFTKAEQTNPSVEREGFGIRP